jgi:integrase/recombinase XerD
MASIQAVLRKKKNAQGLYPIAIRITKDRKSTYLFTGQYINLKDWDDQQKKVKKSHPNAVRLNNLILKKTVEANDTLLEKQAQQKTVSVKKIKNQIIGKNEIDFFNACELFLNNLLKRKKYAQYDNQLSRINIFKVYVGRKRLDFIDLDVTLLKGFEAHLLYERKVAPRTAINYLLLIRTIYNFARKEYGVNDQNYPFGKGKIQIKFPESEKIGLNKEEIGLLETAEGLSEAQQMAVDVWLFSFYFAGIRVGDVLKLKWSDFKDGRLYYRMGKNKKLVSLAMPEKAKNILNKFIKADQQKDDFVFPYLNGISLKNQKAVAVRIKTITRNLNRRLQIVAQTLEIEKPLSMHIARHSFGNLAGDKIPIQMLQKLYRHSSITTTVNYQANFMHKETDDALEKVIGF